MTPQSVQLDIKSQVASKLKRALKQQSISQSELARRMKTSRAVVHRMLNPKDISITLRSLSNALEALGLRATFSLK